LHIITVNSLDITEVQLTIIVFIIVFQSFVKLDTIFVYWFSCWTTEASLLHHRYYAMYNIYDFYSLHHLPVCGI